MGWLSSLAFAALGVALWPSWLQPSPPPTIVQDVATCVCRFEAPSLAAGSEGQSGFLVAGAVGALAGAVLAWALCYCLWFRPQAIESASERRRPRGALPAAAWGR